MTTRLRWLSVCVLIGCGHHDASSPPPIQQYAVSVTGTGAGDGTVTSTPAGITCTITGGAAAASGCGARFDSGAAVSLAASAASGSSFTAWSGACSGPSACAITVASDVTVRAAFDHLPAIGLSATTIAFTASGSQTVNVTNGGGGTLSGLAVGAIAHTGTGGWLTADLAASTAPTTLTLHATTGSLSAGSYSATVPVTATGATNSPRTITVTLTVSPPPTAKVTVAGAGTGSGTVASQGGLSPAIACTITGGTAGAGGCSAKYPAGTHVTLTATAAVADVFGGWSGACSGTSTCSITTTSSDQQVSATFTPTSFGTHPILFETTRRDGSEIWKVNPDGTGLTELTTNHSNELPAWSADATKIAYTHFSTVADVIVMNADGSNPTNITNGGADGSYPRWSPDGTHIASGASQIYVMKADGSAITNITNDGTVEDGFPMWCSNTRIVFSSTPLTTSDFHVYIMNADGTGRTQLAPGARPECSPDGTRILYYGAGGAISIMNIDGTGSHVVMPGRGTRASWSPDGNRFVVDGSGGLHIFATDGSGGTLVVPDSGFANQWPNWNR